MIWNLNWFIKEVDNSYPNNEQCESTVIMNAIETGILSEKNKAPVMPVTELREFKAAMFMINDSAKKGKKSCMPYVNDFDGRIHKKLIEMGYKIELGSTWEITWP